MIVVLDNLKTAIRQGGLDKEIKASKESDGPSRSWSVRDPAGVYTGFSLEELGETTAD